MDQEMQSLIDDFVQESEELLDNIADDILRAEAETEYIDIINSIFRGIHTIKGTAAMLDGLEISRFAHSMEGMLNAIRDEELELDADIVDLVLSGDDTLRIMMLAFKAGDTIQADEELMGKYKSYSVPPDRQKKAAPQKTGKKRPEALEKESDKENIVEETTPGAGHVPALPTEAADKFASLLGQKVNFFKINLTHTEKDLAAGKDPQDILIILQDNVSEIYINSSFVFDSENLHDFSPFSKNIKLEIYIATGLQELEISNLFDDMSMVDIEALPDKSEEFSSEETSAVHISIDAEDLKEFLVGCHEHIEIMEKAVIDYEETGSAESINKLFRGAHTIKGDAGYMHMEQTARFAHELENLLYRLREGELTRNGEIIDLLLKSVDSLKDIIERLSRGEEICSLPIVYKDLRAVCGLPADDQKAKHPGDSPLPDELQGLEQDTREVFLEQVMQQHDVLKRYGYPPSDKNNREIIARAVDGLKCAANFVRLPSFTVIVDRAFAAIDGDETELVAAVSSLESFITGLSQGPKTLGQILVDEGKICEEDVSTALEKQRPLGEILVAQGKVTEIEVNGALSEQKPIGMLLVDQGKVKKEDVEDALQKQEVIAVASQLKETAISKEIRTMRVDEDKVENFSNLIGEMLIARNSYEYLLSQFAYTVGSSDGMKNLKDNLHLFSRLVDDMHHGIMAMRMIPIQGIFKKFNRVVRDISKKQHKQITLVIQGEETKIDKKVADIISDPLIHLIRNSCDHGIELPAVRKAANKPETGTVILSAGQEGGNLVIKIIDDGNGIDGEKLKAKAAINGVDVANMTDSAILRLIFMPGLSIKEQVTDLSGRGVGMDVVKSTIDSLKGTVLVHSEVGKGSELTLSIPMTMGISVILLVEISNQSYGIPFEYVLEAIKIKPSQLHCSSRSMIFHYRNQVIPVDFLENYLVDTDAPLKTVNFNNDEELFLVILKVGNRSFAVIVDCFVRNIEVAIKPLPGNLTGTDLVSGSSILGNGQLILILNPEKIV